MRLSAGSSLALGFFVAAASGAGFVGCKYDPHPINGALRCSMEGECPEGYSCQTNLCWSKSGGPTIMPSGDINDYVGEWLLTVAATVENHCDNGTNETVYLSPADNPWTMTLARGTGATDLLSSWLCDLTLRVDSSGAHLNDSAPSCSNADGDPVYTWTATKFEVVTAVHGTTALYTALYTRKDEYFDGTVANCNQIVNAPMTKQ